MREKSGKKTSSTARRKKALLVEDNDNERELLACVLRLAGLDVDTAGDGATALDYLHQWPHPDVVLMDMGLPRCDGPAVVRHIREDPLTARLKVFAVSGHQPDEFDFGCGTVDGWFAKPVDPEALVRRIQEEMAAAPCGV
jgi:two-component system OmpR family response regulator